MSNDSWQNLWNEIRQPDCAGCSLHEDAQTKCLCGVGPVPADLMVIGEAPGVREDDVSKPFQGRSGKLLDSILAETGITRDKVFVTNAVKCHPPGNRTPEKEEVKTCAWYLQEEIKAVQPKIIITLGNTALQAVTGHSGITSWRGKECTGINGVMTIPTFHPAAVLRSPKYMNAFKADILKATGMLGGNKTRKFEYIIHYANTKESLKELVRHLETASKVIGMVGGADLETTTFDFWRPETKVMTMGLCVDDVHCWAIPLEHAQSPWRGQSAKVLAYIRPYLEHKIKWAGNNWKYDQKWTHKKYGFKINFGPDNMLMDYAMDENSPHDLKYQADYYCQSGHYDKEIVWPKKFDPVVDDINKKVAQYMAMDLKKLLKYNALDAYYTRNVYPFLRTKLLTDMRSARIYKHLLEQGSIIFTEIEENGMWVDPERLEEATIQCSANVEETILKLNNLIPEGWPERNLSKKQLKDGFNWGSTQQLGKLLFQEDGFNLPIYLRTDSGKPSTAETVLIELGANFDHPVVNLITEYRKWAKYMNTYLKPWKAKVDENNRIHPTFKLHGTVTGRLSGEDGVHQVPRDNFIRRLIGAPPGWSFFEIDGSQIELRVVAAIALEETMLRIFSTGGDIHRATAAKVQGIPDDKVTGPDRKKAKAVNFGFVYGMGWKKFKLYAWEKYGVRLTDAEAKLFRQRFFELYSQLPEWHKRMKNLVRKIGFVVSPIGRKRRLPDIFSIDEDMQAAAEREAINSPVQGMGSDVVLGAFIDMILHKAPQIDPNWRESLEPVGAVHDAQYWLIRNDMLEFWAVKIKENFDDLTRLKKWFGYDCPVEIPGDCKVGNHWGEAKDWSPGQPFPHQMR